MLTLYIVIAGTLLTLVLTGFLLGFGARILGSPRGRTGVGIAVSFFLLVSAVAFLALEFVFAGSVLVSVLTLIAEIFVILVVFESSFRLSVGRAWALVGIYMVWIVMQFALEK